MLDFIGGVSSIVGIFGTLFDLFGSSGPSLADLDEKLDQILEKLDEIRKDIHSINVAIQCSSYKDDEKEMSKLLKHLIEQFRLYFAFPHVEAQETVNLCRDPSNGIKKAYNLFQQLMAQEKVMENLSKCGKYESDYVDAWKLSTKKIAFDLIFLTRACGKFAFFFEIVFFISNNCMIFSRAEEMKKLALLR